jgi:hypothetical protein
VPATASSGRPGAGGGADRGRYPDRGRGGQAPDGVAAHEDQSTADEPDAGHDLGGDAGGVQADLLEAEQVAEAVFGDEHERGGPDPDQGVGAQPGALGGEFTLDPDGGAEHEREQQR